MGSLAGLTPPLSLSLSYIYIYMRERERERGGGNYLLGGPKLI